MGDVNNENRLDREDCFYLWWPYLWWYPSYKVITGVHSIFFLFCFVCHIMIWWVFLASCRRDHRGPKRELDQSHRQAGGGRFLCGRVLRRRTLPSVHQPHVAGASGESVEHTKISSKVHSSHVGVNVFTKATTVSVALELHVNDRLYCYYCCYCWTVTQIGLKNTFANVRHGCWILKSFSITAALTVVPAASLTCVLLTILIQRIHYGW